MSYGFNEEGKLEAAIRYNGAGGDSAALIVAAYPEIGILTDLKTFGVLDGEIEGLGFSKPSEGGVKLFIWKLDTLETLSESK